MGILSTLAPGAEHRGELRRRGRRLFCFFAILFVAVAGLSYSTWRVVRYFHWAAILGRVMDSEPYVEWHMGDPTAVYFHNLFANLNLGDDDLMELAKIPTITLLSVRFAPNLSDTGIAHVAEMTSLRHLRLEGVPVGDEGINALQCRPELISLLLAGSAVTDAGVPSLAQLPQLRTLDLTGCNVSATGLSHLSNATSLEELRVECNESELTSRDVEQLRSELPGVMVSCWKNAECDTPRGPRFAWQTKQQSIVVLAKRHYANTTAELRWLPAAFEESEAVDAEQMLDALWRATRSAAIHWFLEGQETRPKPGGDERPSKAAVEFVQHGVTIELSACWGRETSIATRRFGEPQ